MSLLVLLSAMVCVLRSQLSVVVCWHPRFLLEQVKKKKGGMFCLFIVLNICALVTFAGAILFLIFGVFYSVNAYNGLQE